jgi:hypothetical protein
VHDTESEVERDEHEEDEDKEASDDNEYDNEDNEVADDDDDDEDENGVNSFFKFDFKFDDSFRIDFLNFFASRNGM